LRQKVTDEKKVPEFFVVSQKGRKKMGYADVYFPK
jgi:hypothetical protein